MHEDLRRAVPFKTSTDRTFGFVMAGFFAVVALWPLVHRTQPRWWALVVALAFALLAAFWTVPLKPLNRLWTAFGLLLHRIVNPVVLGVIFYGVILPMGVAMRVLGKDPLRLRRSSSARSYWIERTPGPVPQSMKQQF